MTPEEGRTVRPEVFRHIDQDSLAKFWNCSFFSLAQFLALPQSTLGHMNRGCKRTMPHDLVRGLSPARFAALSGHGTDTPMNWTEDVCMDLSPAQVAALGPGCAGFDSRCVVALDASVWSQMTAPCLANIRTDALPLLGWRRLQLVRGDVLAAGMVESSHVRAAGPALCAVLRKEASGGLAPAACGALAPGCVRLIPPAMCKELSARCVANFSVQAMGELGPEQVMYLMEDAFAKLSADQVAALPPDSCDHLAPAQIAALSDDACGAMGEECFNRLTPGAVQKISIECARLRGVEAPTMYMRLRGLADYAGAVGSKAAAPLGFLPPYGALLTLVPLAGLAGVWVGMSRPARAPEYEELP